MPKLIVEMYSVHVDICSQPAKPGPCRGSFERWYFDSANDSCMPFTYGGCKGNDNRFNSLDDCQSHCIPSVLQGKDTELSLYTMHIW